jgi:hypothetical protein
MVSLYSLPNILINISITVYANSLLATLNTRCALTARDSRVHDICVSEIKFDEEARGVSNGDSPFFDVLNCTCSTTAM